MAVDTPDGLLFLFCAMLPNAPADLREGLNHLRCRDVRSRTIPPAEMSGATITLSNYGTLAGRYADLVVVPPWWPLLA